VAAGKKKGNAQGKSTSRAVPATLSPGLIEEFLPGKNMLQNEDPEEEPKTVRHALLSSVMHCVSPAWKGVG